MVPSKHTCRAPDPLHCTASRPSPQAPPRPKRPPVRLTVVWAVAASLYHPSSLFAPTLPAGHHSCVPHRWPTRSRKSRDLRWVPKPENLLPTPRPRDEFHHPQHGSRNAYLKHARKLKASSHIRAHNTEQHRHPALPHHPTLPRTADANCTLLATGSRRRLRLEREHLAPGDPLEFDQIVTCTVDCHQCADVLEVFAYCGGLARLFIRCAIPGDTSKQRVGGRCKSV